MVNNLPANTSIMHPKPSAYKEIPIKISSTSSESDIQEEQGANHHILSHTLFQTLQHQQGRMSRRTRANKGILVGEFELAYSSIESMTSFKSLEFPTIFNSLEFDELKNDTVVPGSRLLNTIKNEAGERIRSSFISRLFNTRNSSCVTGGGGDDGEDG